MRIVTNPGSNLTLEAIDHYDFEIAPQRIVAGAESYDCRAPIALADVDRWVRSSREFPHVVGTTASELVSIFTRVAREDPHVIAVMTSRKVIQSHASALAAAKLLDEHPAFLRARIAVVDSTVTDVGAGLIALAAGEAAKHGVPHSLAVQTLEALAARTTLVLAVSTLQNLVRGGRAGFLRGWLAEPLDLQPLIGFVDGNLKGVGRIPRKADRVAELANHVARSVVNAKRVWIGIGHGGAPDDALRLEMCLRRLLPVEYVYRQKLSASIYLHAGPGALVAVATRMDGLAWSPSVPPHFSEGI